MRILARVMVLAAALAATACTDNQTCEDTCCDADGGAITGMEPGTCAGRSYRTCGTLGSSVIELRVPAQPSCSYDTIDVCSSGALACLARRANFCGISPPSTPRACCPVLHPTPSDCH